MYRTETGLQVLEHGDVVRVGNGKVEYSIINETTKNTYNIQSHNTGKFTAVSVERLSLVRDIRESEDWKAARELEKLWSLGSGIEEEPETLDNSTRALSEEDTKPVKETSAYAKAVLFALNKLRKHVYTGTVRKNVKAKRRALGRRQKASRKANR